MSYSRRRRNERDARHKADRREIISMNKRHMATSRSQIVIAIGLGGLVVAAAFVAYTSVKEGSSTSQTSSASKTTFANVTLIEAGTTQALPYRGGVPVCYDTSFSLTGNGTISGSLKATGLINWYILSEFQGRPISGSIISGTITQTLPIGSYDLKFCNQQRSSLNLTITESFVITQT
jgi:hypothetical protein